MWDPNERLKLLRKEFVQETKGHNARVVGLSCECFALALKILKSKKQRAAFFELIRKSDGKRVNVVTEVMFYVMGAESDRKLVWRRARAIQYLHDEGIELSQITKEVVSRGGIEAVAREAAEHKPLRKSRSAALKSGMKKRSGKFRSEEEGDVVSERAPDPADDVSGEDDVKDETVVTLRIRVPNLDKIRHLNPGRRMKLIITRVTKGRYLAVVKRAVKLK